MHHIDGRPLFPAKATKQKRGKISIALITSNSISFSLSGFFFFLRLLSSLSISLYIYIYIVPTTCEKGIRYDVIRLSGAAGSADPLGIRYFVSILYMVNHCMGTYDGNSRTTMVAVDPFGESERNSRTPWWPLLPGNKHEGLYQRKHSHLCGGRSSSSIAPPPPLPMSRMSLSSGQSISL